MLRGPGKTRWSTSPYFLLTRPLRSFAFLFFFFAHLFISPRLTLGRSFLPGRDQNKPKHGGVLMASAGGWKGSGSGDRFQGPLSSFLPSTQGAAFARHCWCASTIHHGRHVFIFFSFFVLFSLFSVHAHPCNVLHTVVGSSSGRDRRLTEKVGSERVYTSQA